MSLPPPRPPPSQAASVPRPSAPPSSFLDRPSSTSSLPKHDEDQGTFFLGRYRVISEIGRGGMASVHLGRIDGPGGFHKWVAIKQIHAHLVDNDQFVDMFLDEA